MNLMPKIQFRWKRVGIWDGRPHVKVDDAPCVLQFRVQVYPDESSNYEDGVAWSDWEDVEVED